jgi:5-methylcytosine-specific restriction endonuclease McrA
MPMIQTLALWIMAFAFVYWVVVGSNWEEKMKQNSWLVFRKGFLAGKKNFQGYFICEKCKKWVKTPDLHHIKTRGAHPELALNPSNIILLCHDCHLETHGQK